MKKLRKLAMVLWVGLFISGPLFVFTPKVQAADFSGTWLDRSHIQVKIGGKDVVFYDAKTDNDFNYKRLDQPEDCRSDVHHLHSGNTQATITIKKESQNPNTGGSCDEDDRTLSLANPDKANDFFIYKNKGNAIVASDGAMAFIYDNNPKREEYRLDEDDRCKDTIKVKSKPGGNRVGANRGVLTVRTSSDISVDGKTSDEAAQKFIKEDSFTWADVHNDALPYDHLNKDVKITGLRDKDDCAVIQIENVRIGNVKGNDDNEDNDPKLPTDGAGDTSGSGNSDGTGEAFECDFSFTNPLTWIICPIIDLARDTVNTLDENITDSLTIDTGKYFNANCKTEECAAGPAFYKAWSTFRTFSMAILVIAALVMVISQALSFGPFDAYTVKKVLPRIIFAVIFIAISWQLLKIPIQFFNALGNGMEALIAAPFNSLDPPSASDGALALGNLGVVALGLSLNLIGLLTLAITAMIAVLTAFAVITIRNITIFILVMTAPFAIACYILPNTERVWKLWGDWFLRALVAFPLITAFIATGRAFAKVTAATNDGLIGQVITFIAYFGPYFMLPTVFRLAGGAVGMASGALNNATTGMRRGLGGFRKRQMGQKWQEHGERATSGKFFKRAGDTGLRAGLNTAIQAGAHVGRAGIDPTQWRHRVGAAVQETNQRNRDKMLNDEAYTWKNDDDLNRAASETTNAAELRQLLQTRHRDRYAGPNGAANLERDVSHVENMRRKYGNSAFRQASFLQAVAGGTAFDDADVWEAAAAVAGDDGATLSELVAKGRSAAMSAGRVDQGGAGFGDTMRIARRFRDDPTYTLAQANQDLTGFVVNSQGAGVLSHASMKPQAVRNLIPEFQRRIDAAVATGDIDQIDRQLAFAANLHDTLSASSPQLAEQFGDEVMLREINVSRSGTEEGTPERMTIGEAIANRRSSPVFQSTRREYTSGDEEAARRAAGGGGDPTGGAPTNVQPPPG